MYIEHDRIRPGTIVRHGYPTANNSIIKRTKPGNPLYCVNMCTIDIYVCLAITTCVLSAIKEQESVPVKYATKGKV